MLERKRRNSSEMSTWLNRKRKRRRKRMPEMQIRKLSPNPRLALPTS